MKKILVVDDEPDMRDLLKQIIELSGNFTVSTGLNGEEGFKLYQEIQPDLVISDYRMPICDGSELQAKIRSTGNQTPFIFMSGFTEDPESGLVVDNATRVIKKPEDIKSIISIIDEMLAA